MKATLHFDFSKEEKYEFDNALNGWKYVAALQDIDSHLRSKIKYEEKQETTFQEMRLLLHSILKEYDASIH